MSAQFWFLCRLFVSLAMVVAAAPAALRAQSDSDEATSPSDHQQPVIDASDAESWDGYYDDVPRWYGQVDSLWMFRGKGAFPQPLVVDVLDATQTYASTTDIGPGLQVGPRVWLGRPIDDGHAWEVGYFGLYGGRSSATVQGNDNLAIPGDLGLVSLDYYAADVISLQYSNHLHNVELNRVRTEDDFSFLLGVRYVNLAETLRLSSGDVNTTLSNYRLETYNHLFGAQFGLRRVHDWRAWRIVLDGTAGIYGNACGQSQSVEDFASFATYYLRPPTSASTGHVAFVGDIRVAACYALSDRWDLRLGYNLLWLNGMAIAPNQLDFSYSGASGTEVNCGAMVFLHGASAGLEARW